GNEYVNGLVNAEKMKDSVSRQEYPFRGWFNAHDPPALAGSISRSSTLTGRPVAIDSLTAAPISMDAAPSMCVAARPNGSGGGLREKISFISRASPPPCAPSARGIS